ncbi:hypothetical protein [Spirosoma sp. KUDC1026]|uniref:hypothetical protein n=1 Tax=Spirosoma sp. KUDC1026 TaxID=2745947 RepID=UPI00159BCAB2|nr:hypothetical protein [Spirosoma sp. KUDC1026]QKZ12720.1 hypothetical protein HU175_08770 [Spirosoma sp. KUDC1026]
MKELTKEQAKQIILALMGYKPWQHLRNEEEYLVEVTIHDIISVTQANQFGFYVNYALKDYFKQATPLADSNYQLYIGYWEANTQTNPAILSLTEQPEGVKPEGQTFSNVSVVADYLRDINIW